MNDSTQPSQTAVTPASPSMSPSWMALIGGMGYLFVTYLLFFIGPFVWPLFSWWPVTIYIPLIFLALALGHITGANKRPSWIDLPSWPKIIVIGGLSAVILLVPSARIYTGRWPWQVFQALADQKDAYQSLRDQLDVTQGGRTPIVLVRAIFAPFTFAVLPLGIIHWKKLSHFQRILLILTVLSTMIFSALRGTTRELADVLVIGSSAALINSVRNRSQRNWLVSNWGKVVLGIILTMGVFGALIGRTQARLGAGAETVCIGSGYVCPDYFSPPYGNMPDSVAYGMGTLTGYLSQGYYGLGLAMQQPFIFTNGLGHSPALLGLYTAAAGNDDLSQSTYPYRLRREGWSDEYQWSTMLPWLANDVSFWGVPVLIFILGLAWGRSWRDATDGKDDRAAVFFCITMMMIFYLPANNQMMQTFDNYATLIAWLLLWVGSRRRAVYV